jgi:U4/U6.U5 tri-snRNP-associated protein 2
LERLFEQFTAKGYKISKTGRYVAFYIKRFGQNRFFREKNSTVVRFPVRRLELRKLGEGSWDLVAAIAYEGDVKSGRYKAFVHREAGDKYFEMADLLVSEVLPQVIPLSEVCQLVYRRS